MKNYIITIRGLRYFKDPSQKKIPFVHELQNIQAFNLSHALSYALNLAKENHVEIKSLSISEAV